MTQPEPVHEPVPTPGDVPELDEWLEGEEPAWEEEPVPPPDARRANAMIARLKHLARDAANDAELAAFQKAQIDRWLDARSAPRARQQEWLTEALERYHRAVLSLNPRAVTINLPAGTLASRSTGVTWEVKDEEFLPWFVPGPVEERIGELAAAYLEAAQELVLGSCPLGAAVRLRPPAPPEVDVKALHAALTVKDAKGKPVAYGRTPSGVEPPGLEVHVASDVVADRDYDVKFSVADEELI